MSEVGREGGGLSETRATIEVHHFFSEYYPSIWDLKTSHPKKTDLEKNEIDTG